MAKIDIKLIQELRERTAAGMMDCKKALQETNGDIEQAIEVLRKKGAATAAKRASKDTGEGIVHAYIHPGSRVGVLIELDCETDFVARTEEMKNLAQDLCMQIVAMNPLYLNPEDMDGAFLEHERKKFKEDLADSGKPENIIDKIVDGKMQKLASEVCLTKQVFVKNDKLTVEDVIKELIGKLGENIKIKRFARFEIGA